MIDHEAITVACLYAALAAGVIAARASSAFTRWVIGRTLSMEW